MLWYLTNSGVKRDRSKKKRQNQQLIWATDFEKCKFPIKSGLMLSLWRKGEEWATLQAQTAPQSLFCISSCFLTLPSPSPLFRIHLSSQGQVLLWPMLPRRPEQVLGVTTLTLVEICWYKSSLHWCHTACWCNSSNDWLGKFLFQTI